MQSAQANQGRHFPPNWIFAKKRLHFNVTYLSCEGLNTYQSGKWINTYLIGKGINTYLIGKGINTYQRGKVLYRPGDDMAILTGRIQITVRL